MSELNKLYACLRIAQNDESDEEVEFWLKEIEKEKKECPHKSTVALNEEGHAGIYCVSCGKKISNEC